ncbi:MAG: SDR family NAD(P)-dependent oxidoreductase [Candidatus Caenarcaniphilales bacterium]|nr:SDR family NAD(P)-dependent oxidoreductase [Candidatus Caenarcaniphilales bacterium]
MNSHKRNQIAVIGIGCMYPGARTPLELWENILTRRRQFREMPDCRLPNNEYYDPDPSTVDKTYQNKAAVLENYSFNWMGRRIPKKTFESTDIVHWLALDTALAALEDAGYNKERLPNEKTGTIIGNTLTGEFTRSNNMLLRWPFVRKALRTSLKDKALEKHTEQIESTMERYYKSVFAPVTEDTLAGGLANTIAGRICNFLDVHGGGYLVDGACASSLLAICTASSHLASGQMDMAIAGGVDISLDTFELIGFAKTGALTQDEMRVYDKRGKGFLPGEGCGIVILKRLEDAIRDNDQIYSIINGWGISSDGKGGITAPSDIGQSMAIKRAYSMAGLSDTSKIDFIEGHGTGTAVGDRTELSGIGIALNSNGELPANSCGMTSFKSIVGHTKAAAGVGAFIKAVIAVNRRVLPPTAGCKELNPVFQDKAKVLYPLINGQVKDPESIINAGISAMGFGGINSHVVIQSPESLPNKKFEPTYSERKLIVSNQTSEVFFFSARDKDSLIIEIENVLTKIKGISYAELTDFSYQLNKNSDFQKPYRAAVTADTPFKLEENLNSLITELKNTLINDINVHSKENHTIVFGQKRTNLRIGALYPGQGSQRLGMGYKLIERFDWAKELLDQALESFREEEAFEIKEAIYKFPHLASNDKELQQWQKTLKQTNVAQPAIVITSMLWHTYLKKLGINIAISTGHSLGELTSFWSAGVYDQETALRFAAFRGKVMNQYGSGSMASLFCHENKALEFIKKAPGYVTIANLNAPQQTVISGEQSSVSFIVKAAKDEGISALELPVSAAFHSALIADTAVAIKKYPLLNSKKSKPSQCKLISSVTGKEVQEVELQSYFATQAMDKVNFIEAIKSIEQNCDLLLEIGPGKVLTSLVSSITDNILCLPVETSTNNEDAFTKLLANAFVYGVDINVSEVYQDRLIRDFVPVSEKEFLVNPLERPFPEGMLEDNAEPQTILSKDEPKNTLLESLSIPYIDLTSYLEKRGEFIKDIILSDLKYLHTSKNGNETHLREEQSQAKTKVTVHNLEISQKSVEKKQITNPEEGFAQSGSELSKETIRKFLYELVEEKTGFPQSEIKLEYRLLDDLNLDSIKAGSFLNAIVKKYHLQGKLEPNKYTNNSLEELISLISEWVIIEKKPAHKETSLNLQIGPNDIQDHILKLIEEKTGFPQSEIKLEYKLLDDLNLDSIKASSLLKETAKTYRIQGKFETSSYANASIEEIINAVNSLSYSESLVKQSPNIKPNINENVASALDKREKELNRMNEVKSYSVKITEEALNLSNEKKNKLLNNKNTGIVCIDSKQIEFASTLGKSIQNLYILDHSELANQNNLDRLVVFLPQVYGNKEEIYEAVAMLSNTAKFTFEKNIEIAFVQFGDGRFSRQIKENHGENPILSTSSFAASIHLERPNKKIRVIEFNSKINANNISKLVNEEMQTADEFYSVGYDENEKRYKMVYELAETNSKPRSNLSLSPEDIVLVTGGGKGITAECALSLAEKYKCKMALVGSSEISDEIRLTLEKYSNKGLSAKYFTCDINNQDSAQNLIKKISAELGQITIVIHGAGINKPRRVEQVSSDQAISEISPKLIGAINIIESLQDSPLKAFFALTSIIGITGMQGNSWYAFSNEALDLVLRNLKKKRAIETGTFAYSVWDEIGMGAKMGSVQKLANIGIGSIQPSIGIKTFMHWFDNSTSDQQVAVTGSLGNLDTWKIESSKANRYLEDIELLDSGRELRAYASLSREHDKYIDDHNFNGSLLFPAVFGLEAMAEAATILFQVDSINSVQFENISLLRPIVVPEKGEIRIQIKAQPITSQEKNTNGKKVSVNISTEDSNFSEIHFSAELTINQSSNIVSKSINLPQKPLRLDPKTDLYSWLLFQGPMFQNIDEIYSLSNERVLFSTKVFNSDAAEICFSKEKQAPFSIGNPLLRDLLLQSAQIFNTDSIFLPFEIDKWEIHNLTSQNRTVSYIECIRTSKEEQKCRLNVTMFNSDSNIIETLSGYIIKSLKPTKDYPIPEEIADIETLEKQLEDSLKDLDHINQSKSKACIYKHNKAFNELDRLSRHAVESNVFLSKYVQENQFNLNKNENQLAWLDNGQPIITNSDLSISISHSRSLLLICVGEETEGCDIEFIEHRNLEEWTNLIGETNKALLKELIDKGENIDRAATRLWCVKEAFMKAFNFSPERIDITSIESSDIEFKCEARGEIFHIRTCPIQLWPKNVFIVAKVISSIGSASHLIKAKEQKKHFKEPQNNQISKGGVKFDLESRKFVYKFYTSFKDCKSFFGRTYFTNFPLWNGYARELTLKPISQQLLEDFGTGEYGMITNNSEIQIYNEAETLDNIIGKIWITNKSNLDESFIDLAFQWFKEDPNGNLIKLADCSLSTTWVKIEGHGVVKLSPIPKYFYEYLNERIKKDDTSDEDAIIKPYLSNKDVGKSIYSSSSKVRPEILIDEYNFQTGIYDANLVGNLYYSNYYDWQAKCIEKLVFQHLPEIFLDRGKTGEYISLESNVNHLQEAMPFEEIKVKMYLKALYENAFTLYFEYYSLGDQRTNDRFERKLAYGSNTIIWAHRENEESIPDPIPVNRTMKEHFVRLALQNGIQFSISETLAGR